LIGQKYLYLTTPLAFNASTEGFPWDDLREILPAGSQRTKWRRNTAENFNRLSRAHERNRQTTDGQTTAYSERKREFTFAKNGENVLNRQ